MSPHRHLRFPRRCRLQNPRCFSGCFVFVTRLVSYIGSRHKGIRHGPHGLGTCRRNFFKELSGRTCTVLMGYAEGSTVRSAPRHIRRARTKCQGVDRSSRESGSCVLRVGEPLATDAPIVGYHNRAIAPFCLCCAGGRRRSARCRWRQTHTAQAKQLLDNGAVPTPGATMFVT